MHADVLYVLQNVVIPETQDNPPVCFEAAGANPVLGLIAIIAMLGTIDFDDELFGWAGEIDDITGDGQLTAKAEAQEAVCAQFIPEPKFRVRHDLAHAAGVTTDRRRDWSMWQTTPLCHFRDISPTREEIVNPRHQRSPNGDRIRGN